MGALKGGIMPASGDPSIIPFGGLSGHMQILETAIPGWQPTIDLETGFRSLLESATEES
jgi:hypothetical protein